MRISDWSSDVCSSDLGDNIVIYGYPAELARYKWNRWEFQREHRFVLTALRGPRSTDNPHEYGARYYDLVRDPLWQRQGPLSPHIDLKIAPGALQQIAVTIGPLTFGKYRDQIHRRSAENTSGLQSLQRISYADLFFKKKEHYH